MRAIEIALKMRFSFSFDLFCKPKIINLHSFLKEGVVI